MYAANKRPSEIIAEQKRIIEQQESIIETLKGALAASDIAKMSDSLPLAEDLTQQQRALIGALFSAYPRPVDRFDLLERIPGRDHVLDRQIQLVSVLVHRLRKKLGQDAIENVRGLGYRLGRELHETLRDARAAADQPLARAA